MTLALVICITLLILDPTLIQMDKRICNCPEGGGQQIVSFFVVSAVS